VDDVAADDVATLADVLMMWRLLLTCTMMWLLMWGLLMMWMMMWQLTSPPKYKKRATNLGQNFLIIPLSFK
jgi:hypothetical protein